MGVGDSSRAQNSDILSVKGVDTPGEEGSLQEVGGSPQGDQQQKGDRI